MKKLVKHIALKSMLPVLRKVNGRLPKVLFFHGVEERIIDKDIQVMHLAADEFEKQIKYLHRHYHVISVAEYEQKLQRGFNGKEVILTFDDGYQNNLTVVAPVLASYNLPFSVFPSVAYIGTDQRCPTFILRAIVWLPSLFTLDIPFLKSVYPLATVADRKETERLLSKEIKYAAWEHTSRICEEMVNNIGALAWKEIAERFNSDRILSWDELKQLTNYQCEIGSHGMEHGLVHENQDSDFVHRQVFQSRKLLTENVGDCAYYVYPNGGRKDVSTLAEQTVKGAGYRLAFSSVTTRTMDNAYFLPRIGVGSTTMLDDLKLALVRH